MDFATEVAKATIDAVRLDDNDIKEQAYRLAKKITLAVERQDKVY